MCVVPVPSPPPNPQIAANCGRAAAAECRSVMRREDDSKNLPLPLSVCCARPRLSQGGATFHTPVRCKPCGRLVMIVLPTGGLKWPFTQRSSVSFSASSVGVLAGRGSAESAPADSPCWLSRCDPQQHHRPFNPSRRMREVYRQAGLRVPDSPAPMWSPACLFLQAVCVCASLPSRLVSD